LKVGSHSIFLALAFLSVCNGVQACGPFFPNNLLGGGDEVLLAAPVADFRRELARLDLPPSRFEYVAAANGYAQATFDAELADLAAALKRANVPNTDAAQTIEGHRANRAKLREFVAAYAVWDSESAMDPDQSASTTRGAAPVVPVLAEDPDLPAEFADYFAGAVAREDPKANPEAAAAAWERLLDRPAAERKYKSTWAAFMLGQFWEEQDDDEAVRYFQLARDLAKRGFKDSIGLAAAALGLEARVELRRNHFQRAIQLYLEQYASGDNSAVQSLRFAAQQAIHSALPEEQQALVTNQLTRSVILAHLISAHTTADYPTGDRPRVNPESAWLAAVEAAEVKDVDSAERLALAAYQEGDFEMTQRWILRAKNTPVAQWLQAKLLLRAGKIAPAAVLLAQVTEWLPVVAPGTLTNSPEFADSLNVARAGDWEENPARRQVLGDLGTLRLSRGEFEQALDALLRSGFWEDAAYVAERVLTTDELKRYVDREWPAGQPEAKAKAPEAASPEAAGEDRDVFYDLPVQPEVTPGPIRHLLARRLVRELRGNEARAYFPLPMQARLNELIVALDAGWNESSPAAERARSLFAAAKITRADGMELLGTELAPDWFIHGGDFEDGLTWQNRATNASASIVNLATEPELQRAAQSRTDPEARFHYRYQAAFLGWEAAKLLPDNSDETARVLCTAGAWLKSRDPATADLFYKALVRRCRLTAIGAQADRIRWFPVLDADGNPKPYRSRLEAMSPPLAPEESTEPLNSVPAAAPGEAIEAATTAYPLPGKEYIIHFGDSISAIAAAVSRLGRTLTPKEILEANPDLDPARLQVGQTIHIPAFETQSEGEGENAVPDSKH